MKNLLVFAVLTLSLAAAAQAQTYTESILYSFGASATDGTNPNAGLVMDSAGNLYGTTVYGGSNCSSGYCGSVFKLTSSGTETILHSFTGTPDGGTPLASLAIDKNGNLYGTTETGGSYGWGTAFKITAAGTYSILHSFGKLRSDGSVVYGPLTLDSAGNIYGTTAAGGSASTYCNSLGSRGCGTIYKITAAGTESVLYKFTGQNDGANPIGNLIRDGKGNLYGVTSVSSSGTKSGVLFKVTAQGAETTMYAFPYDGSGAFNAFIARNSAGNFYGTVNTSFPGFDSGVWEVASGGVETNYFFCTNCSNTSPSGYPFIGPVMFSGGNLYGTAENGGANEAGVVYEFSPTNGAETVLYNFGSDSTDGTEPIGGVITDSAGNLYGTTSKGGKYGKGAVFKLTKN